MAIKDRSNRRLIRLGIIRLGIKKKSSKGVEYPAQADHFVLKDAPEIATVYGDEPRELDVMLPYPDVERNFTAFYQVWAGGVLVCQGDGEYVRYATPFTSSINQKSGRTSVKNAPGDTQVSNGMACTDFDWNGSHFDQGAEVPCSGGAKDLYSHCAACKLSSMLKVMMVDPRLFRMGYYQISTGSTRNYDTIMGTLEAMPADRLNGIPFKLRMVEEQTTFQDTDGKRKKTKKWFLQLEPDPELVRKLYQRMTAQMIEVPSPDDEIIARIAPPDTDLDFGDIGDPNTFDGELENGAFIDPEPEATPEQPGNPAPAATITIPPMPDGIPETCGEVDWGTVYQQFGFKHKGQAMSALVNVYGSTWREKPTADAWEQLAIYQASKEANGA